MQRIALVLASTAMVAAALPSPGLYLAVGLGVAAVGGGWVGYRDRGARGFPRLAAAAAITLGAVALVLGVVRIGLVLAAIAHLDRMIG